MNRRSRTSLPGVLARQFRADLGPLLAMAAIVLVVATLVSAAPLALRSLASSEVAYQFENLPASRRDLIARSPGTPAITPGVAPFAQFDEALAAIAASAPSPLDKAFATAEYTFASDRLHVARRNVEWNDPQTPITINVAPRLADHIRMVDGTPPAPFEKVVDLDDNEYPGRPFDPFDRNPQDPQIDIALSVDTAEEAGWAVGEERWVAVSGNYGFYARLSGTFEAVDPKDGFWAASPSALQPGIDYTPFGGTNTRIVVGAAFIDPGSWPAMADQTSLSMLTTVAIPFSMAGLTVEEDEAIIPQLRGFTSNAQSVANVAKPQVVTSLTFGSDAETTLRTAISRAATATAVLVMVASGPIGVAIATLWLLSRLIMLRRRDSLALGSARGASDTQLRLSQAFQVLLLSAPAAAIGGAIGYLLFPSSASPVAAWFAAAVAVVPPILIMIAASPRSLRAARGDLDPRARGRYRWVLEIIVLALTALAVFLLLQRGLATSAETVGVDPLLAATPLLLSLSAGLIVLRLYPLPLLGFARSVKRKKGIVAFLGANRSIRDPAAGLAPVLAMVVGLAVAVFSGVLLGTVTGGVSTAAHSTIGADLRIESPILDQKQLDDIAAVKGVEESVSLYQYSRLQNLSVEENLSVPVMVADTAALARVQEGVPGAAHIDLDMTKPVTVDGGDDRIPVLLSPDLAAKYTITEDSTFGKADIVSAGDPGTSPSLSGVADWVLIDTAQSDGFGIYTFLPRITLLRLDPGADIAAVKAELSRIAGPDATIQSPADAAALLNDSPVSGGLQLALLALIAIVALLCAGTVVLALMISGPARERLLALLRTLGLTRSQSRGITGWEIGPTALVAIVTGCILGAALPLIVLAGVDLRPFTGGVMQPIITLNPVLLGIVVGGFALLVVVATAIAMAAARRVSLARSLRTSEEG
ncbi:FtsX-like permease family protein [Leifsonia bigeumensis]|uniref:FtsX-like permease family protein n=1 Tax=Leifsonella bigeumensis TaxID=433643 RepID=A0ABP7F821_9MICO